ncbi:O-fucosyltransferase family protein [Flavobacterium foetidum]|uniref:hypothetical protein n=1 Tax=Flavobacterium foetidum TaxID=2026681 RepID=UPI001074E5E6|nr:hypothetical protein [Flavobacterium foetidum]KAF2513561.1 hypothetical protein E0W73_15040 [Flavobacterium foetidum]
MVNQYIEAYKSINNSISKTELIYPLTNRGFFSEINNLVLAALFCLDNKIKLRLCTRNWVGGKWNDYFIPLLEEYNGLMPVPNDVFSKKREDVFLKMYHKNLKGRKILQDDIWKEMRSSSFTEKYFNFPELGIDGSIFAAKRQLCNILLSYNKETYEEVFLMKQADSDFVKDSFGIHIRRGDKVSGKTKEAELFDVELYLNKVQEINSEIKKITICTDDYNVVENFQEKSPGFIYLSFCDSAKNGYFQAQYNKTKDIKRKRAEVIDVLKDANLLINSKIFIGTNSSNISRFVTLMRNNKDCYSLDTEWSPL